MTEERPIRRLHVVPHEGHWEVREERTGDAISAHFRRADAEREAGRLAAARGNTEVVVHAGPQPLRIVVR